MKFLKGLCKHASDKNTGESGSSVVLNCCNALVFGLRQVSAGLWDGWRVQRYGFLMRFY